MDSSGTGQTDRRQTPRKRNALSRQLLVTASLDLLDRAGVSGFSLPALGRHLGCDATAVYRYFPSKDDLLLAVADELIAIAMADPSQDACWVDVLTGVARRSRKVYLDHPAAACLSAYRVTGGPAELAGANIIIGAVLAAGFTDQEAADAYRVVVDFVLYWCGGEASVAALGEDLRAKERQTWNRAYLGADPQAYPNIWAIREFVATVDDQSLFERAVVWMLTGLVRNAPKPCDCPEHAELRVAAGRED